MASCLLAFIAGCEEIDDQTMTPPNRFEAANPRPTARDFVGNNGRHQILMAVIDSGTDYNHPLILNNIHFKLDGGNRPVGTGYDFVGNDPWPSPYVARTVDLNPDAPTVIRQRSQLAARRFSLAAQKFPKLASFFNPDRQVEGEGEDSVHGTHVAGLMVYDEPRLGLLIYRILPLNIKFKNGQRARQDIKEVFSTFLNGAVKQAVSDGARVINMSLALQRQRTKEGTSNPDYKDQMVKMAEIERLAKQNPNVVFVAAAGNDGKWIDDRSRLQLPCGVKAPNILCVGSLDPDNGLSPTSNILISQGYFVAAPGEEILSLAPVNMCMTSLFRDFELAENSFPGSSPDADRYFWPRLQRECAQATSFAWGSGTSMASPIVARMIGKILLSEPGLTGQQAIEKLLAEGDKIYAGTYPLLRLRATRPSWYPRDTKKKPFDTIYPSSLTPEKTSSQGEFEFFSGAKSNL